MAEMYALTIGVESYEYDGEFYIVGEGYGTPSEVLQHVAADHILRISQARHIGEYLLDVLQSGENVSEAEYETVAADVECGIHVDVDYQRFAFWMGDEVVEIGEQPTKVELNEMAEKIRSQEP